MLKSFALSSTGRESSALGLVEGDVLECIVFTFSICAMTRPPSPVSGACCFQEKIPYLENGPVQGHVLKPNSEPRTLLLLRKSNILPDHF